MPTSISMTRNSQPFRASARQRPPGLIIIGIDPGTLVTGYSIIELNGATPRLLECGTIRSPASLALPDRLHVIYSGIRQLITRHRPSEMAIESAFYGKNAQSALKLGHARGVSLLAAVENGLPTTEYSPREIKKAVVGRGAATKQQVRYMVRSLLHLGETRMALDTSDAVAIALCHLQQRASAVPHAQSWSAYVAAHPEKVRR